MLCPGWRLEQGSYRSPGCVCVCVCVCACVRAKRPDDLSERAVEMTALRVTRGMDDTHTEAHAHTHTLTYLKTHTHSVFLKVLFL